MRRILILAFPNQRCLGISQNSMVTLHCFTSQSSP